MGKINGLLDKVYDGLSGYYKDTSGSVEEAEEAINNIDKEMAALNIELQALSAKMLSLAAQKDIWVKQKTVLDAVRNRTREVQKVLESIECELLNVVITDEDRAAMDEARKKIEASTKNIQEGLKGCFKRAGIMDDGKETVETFS